LPSSIFNVAIIAPQKSACYCLHAAARAFAARAGYLKGPDERSGTHRKS
jgi:hypothetical protein